jgi:hypothetical protein
MTALAFMLAVIMVETFPQTSPVNDVTTGSWYKEYVTTVSTLSEKIIYDAYTGRLMIAEIANLLDLNFDQN